ncbi:MAG: hypothetical protein JSR59_06990 [Proteobacteria bacterium]|nr:hypothetical protein [Pseudomonadota bacterium]
MYRDFDSFRKAQRPSASSSLRRTVADIAHGVLIGGAILAVGYTAVSYQHHHAATAMHASPIDAAMRPAGLMRFENVRPPVAQFAQFNGTVPSANVKQVADWVADSRDNRARPFAILDKADARVYVFDSGAHLIGASPVLLGRAIGDDSAPGIGQRPMSQVRPDEKTTPAGRFESHPGRNSGGEDVVWVDYEDAVSMHRVRVVDPKEQRLKRLTSTDPAQRRISYGCINVPVAFFDMVVQPMMARGAGVVYVLPETRALTTAFNLYDVGARQAARQSDPRVQVATALAPRV